MVLTLKTTSLGEAFHFAPFRVSLCPGGPGQNGFVIFFFKFIAFNKTDYLRNIVSVIC